MTALFKSEQAKAGILEWYERFLGKLPVAVESRVVATGAGETHVAVAGLKDGPPLVVLHGALSSSAHVLGEIVPLLETYRVYAVDVVGQSVKSAEARLSVASNDYGVWLSEVMEGLSLPRAHVLGVSWGGFVAIRLAAVAPEKIERLVLIVPAGVVKTPLMNNMKVGIPMTMFMMSPTPEREKKFLATQLTTVDDEDWAPYLAAAFRSYNLSMKVPALAKVEELRGLKAPVMVVAADRDLSFPGEQLLRRAAELFENLEVRELLEDSAHCPPTTDAFRAELSGKIGRFLGGN